MTLDYHTTSLDDLVIFNVTQMVDFCKMCSNTLIYNALKDQELTVTSFGKCTSEVERVYHLVDLAPNQSLWDRHNGFDAKHAKNGYRI